MLKFTAVLLLTLVISAGCNRPRSITTSTIAQANTAQETPPKSHDISDPSCCGLSMPANKGIGAAWTAFTKDGHYRLALERDMQFSDAARREMARTDGRLEWSALNKIVAFSWGHLGYDTDQDLVAAIVVDTTRSDSSRFSLVIFGKPRGAAYRPYWLYRDRDLSKTIVYQVTGSLGVMNYQDDGTYEACSVEWLPQRKLFSCR